MKRTIMQEDKKIIDGSCKCFGFRKKSFLSINLDVNINVNIFYRNKMIICFITWPFT